MTNVNDRRRRASGHGAAFNPLIIFAVLLVLIVAVVASIVLFTGKSKIIKKVTMEAGGKIEIGMFLKDETEQASFRTDVNSINTAVPGKHSIVVSIGSRNYTSTLTIQDTVPPTAEPVSIAVELGELPDPADCVANIVDVTDVTVTYMQEPDVNTRGQHAAVLLLTDAGGNTFSLISVVTVYGDSIPPVIKGARNIVAYVGDEVDFLSGITVSDSVDSEPTVNVDLSEVNFQAAGTYQVTYRAKDKSGNTSEFTISLVLREKRTNNVAESVIISLARDALARFTNSRMDKMDIAYAIYRWVKYNINYIDIDASGEVVTWTGAAYDALQTHSGDAFSCFAVTKALLTAAGITNRDIMTSDKAETPHYWCLVNLGDGWYHMDPFPRRGDGDDFFLVTDAELEVYSASHNNSHLFDSEGYPARATESLQYMVDYTTPTLNHDALPDDGTGDGTDDGDDAVGTDGPLS